MEFQFFRIKNRPHKKVVSISNPGIQPKYKKPSASAAFGLAHIEEISKDYNQTISYLIVGHFRPKRFHF